MEPSVGLLLAGTATSAIGSFRQAGAQKAEGAAQQALLENQAKEQIIQAEEIAEIETRNAALAKRQADEQLDASKIEARRFKEEGERFTSTQRAKIAKSGVLLRGSPLEVLVDTAENLEHDRLNIIREGIITSETTRAQAGIFEARAKAAKRRGAAGAATSSLEGTVARARGRSRARTSILTGIGSSLSGIGEAAVLQRKLGRQT